VFADLGVNSGIGGRCDFPFNVDCKDRPELRNLIFSFNPFDEF
jgi:hypothetical protein